jgi:hypothetical protein
MPDTTIPVDEFHGQGGSYVLDPVTGARTLVERTQEPEQPQAPSGAQE